jgi:hypothetical protein
MAPGASSKQWKEMLGVIATVSLITVPNSLERGHFSKPSLYYLTELRIVFFFGIFDRF